MSNSKRIYPYLQEEAEKSMENGDLNIDNSWVQMHIKTVIVIKSTREIEWLKKSNAIVAEVLRELKKGIAPGITTEELDRIAEGIIRARGAIPAFKGYRGYPKTVCASINEEVVHGIPRQRRLKEGDIVSVDVGANLNGYYGDAAVTLPVGEVDDTAKRLLHVTEQALYMGIEEAKAGNRLFDISHAIQAWVESHGFSVVRDFVGHGIGKSLHEEPQIPNFGESHHGPRLEEGMVFALEPMVNEGSYEVKVLSDGWTVVTADGRRSAHFEHTIAITDKEAEILSIL
jgi:methionyl aminopeptidase